MWKRALTAVTLCGAASQLCCAPVRAAAARSAAAVAADATFSTAAGPGAPLRPFHYAFPVHDLEAAREFYGGVLGLEEGRSAKTWQDYSLFGHQIVAHLADETYRHDDHYNPVDADDVPVSHFGAVLELDDFHALAKKLKEAGVKFIIEPHLRFEGQAGEQWTMFFKDPSGNNLEFKSMTNPDNLFAKYVVEE